MKTRIWTAAFAAILFLCPASVGLAGNNAHGGGEQAPVFRWEPLGLGGGGAMYTPAMGAANPDRVLLNCDMSGAYRSDDSGQSWEMIPHAQLRGNTECRPAFHPTDPDTVFAANGWEGSLRVSRDGGRTFRPIGNLPGGLRGEIRIDPDVPERMLAGVGNSAWVSLDGGERWQQCEGIRGKVLGFHFDRSSPTARRTAYAATGTGVFRSDDGGANWKPITSPLSGSPLLAFAGASSNAECALYVSVEPQIQDGAYSGGVFGSFDGGRSWQSLMRGAINRDIVQRDEWADGPIARYVALLACDAAPRTLYAFNTSTGFNPPHHNAVWKTEDAGETWRPTFFSDPRWPEYNVSPNWRTVNIGQNYQSAGLGWCIAPGDPDRVLFVDWMKCYGTRDGGKTWFTGNSQPAGNLTDPANPVDSRWHHQGLLVTTTWDYLIDQHDPRTHYLAYTDIGFARSTDAGRTWNWWGKGRWPEWRNTCYAIAPDPDRKGTLWGAFSEVHDIPNANIILERHPSKGSGGVAVSRDAGISWTAPANVGLPDAPVTDLVFLPAAKDQPATLLAAVWGHGVYRSQDEGATWKALGSGLGSETNRRVSRLLSLSDGTLLAVVTARWEDGKFSADGPGLYRLTPGSTEWNPLTSPGQFLWPKDLTVGDPDGKTLYLGAANAGDESGGLYASHDAGATWRRILRAGPEHFGAYPDPARPGWIYATLTEGAPGSGLFLSRDGGSTFAAVDSFPFANVQRVRFDTRDPGVLYVTTFGGGAWKGTLETKTGRP